MPLNDQTPAVTLFNSSEVEVGTAGNPLRIDPTGTTSQPVSQPPNIDAGNSSTAPLGIGGVFTGTGLDVSPYAVITVAVFADQAGTLQLQFSTDNANWNFPISFTVPANSGQHVEIGPQARFFRVVYTNGGVAQTVFRLQSIQKRTASATPVVSLASAVDPNGDALLTKSSIVGKTTAGGGSYVDVKVNPSGALTVEAQGPDADGAAPTGKPLQVAGFDGANIQTLKTDTTGRAEVIGGAAAGAALAGNPIPVAGSDGANAQIPRVFDLDTGAGTQFALGANLRRSAAGGSVELLGQTTMAQSLPVTIASDQSRVPIADTTTGTLANGTQTAVSNVAVSVLAANANRKAAIIQNVGVQTVRIGVAGVTNTTGIQLTAGATMIFDTPYVVTGQIFAIREGGADSTVFATEIT